MSTMLYTVTSRETRFDGKNDIEDMRKDADCWYEGSDREKSLEIARKYSDDVVEVDRGGISRDVYQWNEFEIDDDEIIGCMIKIYDPLNRFKTIKNFAERAHACKCDVISYIVGDREWIGEFSRGNHVLDLYRYTGTAFGDFTAFEEDGNLWIPEAFSDYAIMTPDELMRMINEGVKFWQDWQTDDPKARLLYKIFQNY